MAENATSLLSPKDDEPIVFELQTNDDVELDESDSRPTFTADGYTDKERSEEGDENTKWDDREDGGGDEETRKDEW